MLNFFCSLRLDFEVRQPAGWEQVETAQFSFSSIILVCKGFPCFETKFKVNMYPKNNSSLWICRDEYLSKVDMHISSKNISFDMYTTRHGASLCVLYFLSNKLYMMGTYE